MAGSSLGSADVSCGLLIRPTSWPSASAVAKRTYSSKHKQWTLSQLRVSLPTSDTMSFWVSSSSTCRWTECLLYITFRSREATHELRKRSNAEWSIALQHIQPRKQKIGTDTSRIPVKKNWVVIEVSQTMKKCPYLETHVPWVMKFHKIFPREEVAALLTACPHQEEKVIVLLLEIEI